MNISPSQDILTVSQLTRKIKNILESDFRFIRISGEISNFKLVYSGHSYFTLKDSSAQIRGVLFKQQKRFVELDLKNGQQVICYGRISLYEPRGEYQIIVDSVELFGTGQLQQQFEQLKQKLSGKGYFLPERKKELPAYPSKIVVISSPTGAAIQDFLKIVQLRLSPVHIQLLPVRVQGDSAAGEIERAIRLANELPDVDAIVLCRGGGSLEDLWAFNEERVADAIYHSTVPVVTGVGHEVDFTIADFCADHRSPTPTGAAEHLIPDGLALRQHISTLHNSLKKILLRKMDSQEQKLRHNIKQLANMKNLFKNSEYRLQLSSSYLVQAWDKNILKKEHRLQTCINRLQAGSPSSRIELQTEHLNFLIKQLQNHMARILERKKMQLARQASLLNSVSPLATLARGYSVVRQYNSQEKSYRVISSSAETNPGDKVNILLHQGQLDCTVDGKK